MSEKLLEGNIIYIIVSFYLIWTYQLL